MLTSLDIGARWQSRGGTTPRTSAHMAAASDDDAHARALAEAARKSHVTLQETFNRVEMEVVRRSRIGEGD